MNNNNNSRWDGSAIKKRILLTSTVDVNFILPKAFGSSIRNDLTLHASGVSKSARSCDPGSLVKQGDRVGQMGSWSGQGSWPL